MSAAAYRGRSPVAEWEVRQLRSKTGIELAEYPAFEKLATKWSELNPVENALLSRSPMKDADTMNVTVDFNGVDAVLVKSLVSNAWVLNGWKVKPVVAEAGYVAPGATQSNTTTARDGVGAGFAFNVPMLSRAGNTPTASDRADAILAQPAVIVQRVDSSRHS